MLLHNVCLLTAHQFHLIRYPILIGILLSISFSVTQSRSATDVQVPSVHSAFTSFQVRFPTRAHLHCLAGYGHRGKWIGMVDVAEFVAVAFVSGSLKQDYDRILRSLSLQSSPALKFSFRV